MPSPCPFGTVQIPLQQSAPVAHASDVWPQNDEAWQEPPVHSPEQHCELVEHGLPRVAHVVVSGAHDPPTQFWLQQSPLVVQAA